MKPSEDPRSPFSDNYKAQINWRPMQQVKDNGETVTKNLEKARRRDPNHDKKVGVVLNQVHRGLSDSYSYYGYYRSYYRRHVEDAA